MGGGGSNPAHLPAITRGDRGAGRRDRGDCTSDLRRPALEAFCHGPCSRLPGSRARARPYDSGHSCIGMEKGILGGMRPEVNLHPRLFRTQQPARVWPRVVVTAVLIAVSVARAESGGACEEWFPDLNCDRQARWEGFRKPIVAPYLFEDPFVTTGASLYYILHDFPDDSAMGGGEAHVAALQLRLALKLVKERPVWSSTATIFLPNASRRCLSRPPNRSQI